MWELHSNLLNSLSVGNGWWVIKPRVFEKRGRIEEDVVKSSWYSFAGVV